MPEAVAADAAGSVTTDSSPEIRASEAQRATHPDSGGSHEAFQAIQSALRELTVPLIGSTITPIVVFLPLVSITGVTGSFFRALAITMTVSLFTSLLLALSWTPTLSQYLVRRGDVSPIELVLMLGATGAAEPRGQAHASRLGQ